MIETPCDKGPDDEPVAMFEADKGTELSHPNIVQTYKSSSTISKVGASKPAGSRRPASDALPPPKAHAWLGILSTSTDLVRRTCNAN